MAILHRVGAPESTISLTSCCPARRSRRNRRGVEISRLVSTIVTARIAVLAVSLCYPLIF
jgi:hypothetical protein